MQQRDSTLDCYNKTADAYGRQFFGELAHKPLDRLLLERFAAENQGHGPVADLGCGSGQTTSFLHNLGLTDVVGIDLSSAMVDVARRLTAGMVRFEQGDLLQLDYPDATFGAVLAFYAIVHLAPAELPAAFAEVRRVLEPGGQFLFSFHAGREVIHLDRFLDQDVEINFYCFEPDDVLRVLTASGWEVLDALVRYPYIGKEHPSRRAYVVVRSVA